MSDLEREKKIKLRKQDELRQNIPGVYEVPLAESLLHLKGHLIDDIQVTEDKDGLHVLLNSTKLGELEPENDMAISYGHMSFFIPKNKCKECIWTFTTKNEPILAEDPAKPSYTG